MAFSAPDGKELRLANTTLVHTVETNLTNDWELQDALKTIHAPLGAHLLENRPQETEHAQGQLFIPREFTSDDRP